MPLAQLNAAARMEYCVVPMDAKGCPHSGAAGGLRPSANNEGRKGRRG